MESYTDKEKLEIALGILGTAEVVWQENGILFCGKINGNLDGSVATMLNTTVLAGYIKRKHGFKKVLIDGILY